MAVVDELNRRLADGEVVVIDGGMGTELQARGVPMDHEAWCGLANLEYQDVVRNIHEDYIRAGADVHITNTFSTSRFMLELAGYGNRVEEINRRAVEAVLEARERVADRPVFVAGSMARGAWGVREASEKGLLGPDANEGLLRDYREQASILAEAGVDLIVLETLASQWSPVLQAAAETGLPVWIGPRVRIENGKVVADHERERRDHGEDPGEPPEFAEALQAMLDPSVTAVTVMHSELEPIVPALEIVKRQWKGPFGAYPHVGTFERPIWIFTDITPDEFAHEALRWVEQGAQLVGGCCGIRPEHIRAVKEHLPGHIPEATRR